MKNLEIKYEYRVLDLKDNFNEDKLNHLGTMGFQLVHVAKNYFVVMRQKVVDRHAEYVNKKYEQTKLEDIPIRTLFRGLDIK